MSNPNVNTREYENAHGKRPRGLGYWAFFPERRSANESNDTGQMFWHNGTYSEAKAAACAHYKAAGITAIRVGS